MAKTRVHELAKEYGVESKFVLDKLKEMGEFVKSASSTIELPVEMRFWVPRICREPLTVLHIVPFNSISAYIHPPIPGTIP